MDNPFTEHLRPTPSQDSQPYWEGMKEGRLQLQKCADCDTIRHYPRPVCDRCYSMNVDWINASGRATVHSWTVSHHAFHPSFKKDLPLTLVTVDLEEGVRLCAPMRAMAPDALTFGAPMRVAFEFIDEDLTVSVLVLE